MSAVVPSQLSNKYVRRAEVAVVWVECCSSHSLNHGTWPSGHNQTGMYNKTVSLPVPIVTVMLDSFLARGLIVYQDAPLL
jgi:hypothetical protein